MTKKIVLDCDGVLLDYSEAYKRVYEQHFSETLSIINPLAFHSEEYYGISFTDERRLDFEAAFNRLGWCSMQALPGAIEATHLLKKAGYSIHIVTSIPMEARLSREQNLRNLGFMIDEVITTGQKIGSANPKRDFIHDIHPDFFVDDMMANFQDIDCATHFVLIENRLVCAENQKLKESISIFSQHTQLLDFVHSHIAIA
jgi:hypothetical protein